MRFDFQTLVDWISVASAAATVLAAILALVAIRVSARQARDNARLIAQERHTALQLELLTDLLDLINGAYLQPSDSSRNSAGTMRWRAIHARLRIIEAELPMMRIRYKVWEDPAEMLRLLGVTSPRGVDYNDERVGSSTTLVRDRLFDEVVDAIATTARTAPARA